MPFQVIFVVGSRVIFRVWPVAPTTLLVELNLASILEGVKVSISNPDETIFATPFREYREHVMPAIFLIEWDDQYVCNDREGAWDNSRFPLIGMQDND